MKKILALIALVFFSACAEKKENNVQTKASTPQEEIVFEANYFEAESDTINTFEQATEKAEIETVPKTATHEITETNYEDVSSEISIFQLGSYSEEEEMPSSYKEKKWTAFYVINNELQKQSVELEFGIEEMQECGDDTQVKLKEGYTGPTPLFLISGLQDYEGTPSPNIIDFEFKKGEMVDSNYGMVHSLVKWTALKTVTNDTISQSLLHDEQVSLETNYNILYQGDIDGDGQADLVADMAEGYSYSRIVLFLSSRAKEGEVLAAVAQFLYWYC